MLQSYMFFKLVLPVTDNGLSTYLLAAALLTAALVPIIQCFSEHEHLGLLPWYLMYYFNHCDF